MTTTALPYEVARLVLHALAAGRDPDQVAQTLAAHPSAPALDADQVEAIGLEHGFPDPEQLRRSVAELDRQHRLTAEPTKAVANLGSATVRPEPGGYHYHGRPAPIGDDDKTSGRFIKVPVTRLRPNPANPREHLTDIPELAASIREAGLIQPIVVRPADDGIPGYVIVAGHRRHAAVMLLGWERVDVLVRGDMRSDDDLAAALIENGQRAGLDPIEEARALQLLKTRMGSSDLEVGKRIGFSQIKVSGRLALLALTPEEQDEIRRGEMTITHGTAKGRAASGRVRATGQTKGWHLDHAHPLAALVRARCKRLGHSRGRTVGGQGCGDCWESVIRADERKATAEHGARTGTCPTCSAPYRPQVLP